MSKIKIDFKMIIGDIYGRIKKTFKKIVVWHSNRQLSKLLSKNGECSTYVGMPGAGKTTFCAYVVSLCLKANNLMMHH